LGGVKLMLENISEHEIFGPASSRDSPTFSR